MDSGIKSAARRRTKLHTLLLDYGSPVQYSVFECLLEAGRFEKMKTAIRKVTRPRKDNVRYYWLCADCMKKIEAPGGEVVTEPSKAVIV